MGFAAAILAMVLLFAGCGQTETKTESSGTKSTGSESTVSESTQTESSTAASETEDETLVHVLALKGPTGMGMVKMMSDNDSKESPADTFELAAAPDEVSAKLVQGEVDIAAVPANLASVLYNKTNGRTFHCGSERQNHLCGRQRCNSGVCFELYPRKERPRTG